MTAPGPIVVTGAAGFIGRALARHLIDAGHHVLPVDRDPCDLPGAWQIDLATPHALAARVTPGSTIFHLAASADVAGSVADPRHDLHHTFAPMFEALEAARQRGCRLIFPSSAAVFEGGQPLPLREDAAKSPVSPYGAAKLAGEAYCAAYHRSFGTDVRVARMFNVYGVGMRRFAIHDLIRKVAAAPAQLELLGDGSQLRDYLYIDDAVRGLIAIAERGRAGEDYNLASGAPVRMLDLAREIAAQMGRPEMPIVPTGRSFPGDIPRWYGDVSKVRAIGFTPQVGLAEGLRRTIAWLVPEQASR